MDLNERIDLLIQLGKYMLSDDEKWLQARTIAHNRNSWFTHQHIDNLVHSIASAFLQQSIIENWLGKYNMPKINQNPLSVGIVMAGNIPLVGFHDFLCTFITGHQSVIKLSSKDNILLKHLIEKMYEWNNEVQELVKLSDTLKGCDAYIATGSNNSSRYFEYYFSKYPHIIRRNRTSVAILGGQETKKELEELADDICLYFGLGCRNITHIFIPPNYNFTTLLEALKKYTYFIDFHKYKNNYDYQLALHLLNNTPYMSNGSILLVENESLFSPIAQLHYSYYQKENDVINKLPMEDIQCVIGHNFTAFGQAQNPSISDYADGVNTIQFLLSLNKQKKMIHITFEQPNIETLQKSFEIDATLQGEIIEIKDDLAVGPIANIYTDEGHNSRLEWWQKILEFSPYSNTIGSFDDRATVQTLKEILNQTPFEEVWIWMGQNQHDVCSYYWLMSQLKNYQGRIHVLYLNNLPFINEKGNIFYPTHLHQIQPKEFLKAKKLARLITPSEFEIDPDEWNKLCDENATIRILEGGKKIVSKEESFYDKDILNATTSEFQKLNKILHNILAKMAIQTGDAFLAWRIRELAQLGKLEIKGDWSKGWKEVEIRSHNNNN